MGHGSLQGGDSMVNIVEFEDQMSAKGSGHRQDDTSVLSTPFKYDEPSDRITNLKFMKKATYSQSVLGNPKEKDEGNDREEM